MARRAQGGLLQEAYEPHIIDKIADQLLSFYMLPYKIKDVSIVGEDLRALCREGFARLPVLHRI